MKILDDSSVFSKRCNCLPTCSSVEYFINTYQERIPGNDGNVSSFSIYFADDEFIVFRRSASFGAVSLLSNVGGLLGLFLGISVLSIVELFYYFVIRFVNNLWLRQPQ